MCAASAIDKPGRSKVRTNLSAHILVRTPFRTSHTCHRIVIVLALNCRSVIHPLSIPTPGQCQWLRSKLADPNVPKHKGLTMFWIDMKDPAVEVRPIKQMSGGAEFNEVFFTNLRVKDSQRLGNPGDGWKVALTTLMNERLAVGGSQGNADTDDLIELARDVTVAGEPAIRHGGVRERIADWYVQAQGLKFTKFRTLTALSKGETPGPESSISKIVAAKKMQDLGSFGMDLQDMGGVIRDRKLSPADGAYTEQWIGAAGYRIAGGTDEILRNIVAERVLGLPGDVRVDKDLPFNQAPKGK